MGAIPYEQTVAIIEATKDSPDYVFQIIVGVAIAVITGFIFYTAKRIKK